MVLPFPSIIGGHVTINSFRLSIPPKGPSQTRCIHQLDSESQFPHKIRSTKHETPERQFFFDNILVRIYFIFEMILADRPCAMGVWIPFSRQPYRYLPKPHNSVRLPYVMGTSS